MRSWALQSRGDPGGTACRTPAPIPGSGPLDPLGGGCCGAPADRPGHRSMGRPARSARAAVGLGCLALAGFLVSRSLPGRVSLWPRISSPA
jgi:hypothetical protein